MQDTTYSLGSRAAGIRAELRGMRAARAARKALRRDLAVAVTPADFQELDAIIARYDDDDTADIRHMLNERRPAGSAQPAAGFGRTSSLS